MGDCRALQAGTSHNLGQNFAKAVEGMYQDENGGQGFGWGTSWGVGQRGKSSTTPRVMFSTVESRNPMISFEEPSSSDANYKATVW